ncbi:MAG: hypothetical protein H0V44_02105 [Planctomycetes bacterium]|nr:hypothetical protein [Planctomycetota bacterium]
MNSPPSSPQSPSTSPQPPTPSTACSTCQNPISADELAQGLAVKVDGQFVCPMCVDNLPGKAQVEINRFRALKGLNATTYVVPDPRHPDHQRFSFTTAGNVLIHRRTLRDTGSFTAPPLPAIAEKAPSSSANRAVSSAKNPVAAVPGVSPPRHRLPLIAGGAVAGVMVIGVLVAIVTKGSAKPAAVLETTPVASAAVAETVITRTRGDYPREALAAWRAAANDPRCPDGVIAQISTELTAVYDKALDALAKDLDSGRLAEVRAGLDRLAIVDDRRFVAVHARAEELRARVSPRDTASPEVGDDPAEVRPDAPVVHTGPADAVSPAPPAPECWLFTGTDLVGGRKVPFWKANGELSGVYGTLERALPEMAGGGYQVWIRAVCPSGKGSLSVLIDGEVVGKVTGAECATPGWRPLTPSVVVRKGATAFAVKASGPGWRVDQVYLAGSDRAGPDGNASAQPPPWPAPAPELVAPAPVTEPADPKPAVETAKPVHVDRAVTDWKRVFVWPLDAKPEPLDGTADLPSPWPSGADPFQRSQRPPGAGRMQTLHIELPKASVVGGGVVVLMHRVRSNRKTLNLWVESTIPAKSPKSLEPAEQVEHQSIALEPLKFSETGDWQVFDIPFPDIDKFGSKLWLKFEDAADLGADRGFLLGKVVAVANTAPELGDIDLMPAPLVAGDIIANKEYQHRLIVLLDQVAAKRPSKKWNDPKLFDPKRIKLLVTNADKLWETQMRKDIVRLLGREPPNKTVTNLGIAESWFPEQQFKPSQPMVTPEECSLLVLAINGEETTCSLKDPDALMKWTRRLVTEVIGGDAKGRRGGFLPVLVVGRTTKLEDPSRQAAIDAAWPRVREDCANLGIPLIDIRNAQLERLKHDVRESSAQLMTDGLRTLVYQISWAQKKYVK